MIERRPPALEQNGRQIGSPGWNPTWPCYHFWPGDHSGKRPLTCTTMTGMSRARPTRDFPPRGTGRGGLGSAGTNLA
jgi:hypothetical protein